MAGWIILGILLVGLLILTALLMPLAQIRASYNRGEAGLWAQYGPLTVQLYPPRPTEEKGKKPKQKKALKSEKKGGETEKKKLAVTAEQMVYALETLPPILARAAGRARRGIRLCPLKVHLLIAGEDPAGTAVLYGRAQAALAAGMPVLRRAVRVREEDIQLFLDFQCARPDCIADIGVSIRGWDGARIALCAGGSLVKWFLGFRKLAPPAEKEPVEEKQGSGAA